MELNEKLQLLRKQKGLTQEELAEKLYVSRTAVSKWESGRGMPGIDSLKAISRFFAVSLDDLLSGDALLSIAENERREREASVRRRVFGLLDCCMALLLFLPFFGQQKEGEAQGVSLLSLTEMQMYLKICFGIIILGAVLLGLALLLLRQWQHPLWQQYKLALSLSVGAIALLLFMLGRQPYAAVFAFSLLAVKGVMLIRQR